VKNSPSLHSLAWSLSTLTALLLAVAPASASTPASACTALCGETWQLDTAASDDPAKAIETAVLAYKEEKPKRPRGHSSDLASMYRAEDEASLGPLFLRPRREELRLELVRRLTIPQQLRLSVVHGDILVDESRGSPRRFTPGEPHARVDAQGTANIRANWTGNKLVIREDYGRKVSNRETYALDSHGLQLIVTRVLERPAMPDITLRSVYRRETT
jgi:hypothetical protein